MTSAKSFAVLQSETSWGTVGSDVDRYIPLTNFALKADVETREAKVYTGVRQQKFAEKVRRKLGGTISCPLYGFWAPSASQSFAQYLIEWAFGSPGTADRDSKSLNWIDDVSASRWSGLRVDEATLSGDPSGVTLSLTLAGKAETGTTWFGTLPNNRGHLLEFLFADVALTFDGSALPIESFSYTIRHNLALKFNSGYEPSSLRSAGSQQSLTIKPLKTSAAMAVLQRLAAMSHKTASMTLSGRHAGTGASGTATQVVFAFNRLAIIDANDSVTPDDYNWQPITMSCLKPNSSTMAVGQTWSLI
jgi:hypothetical protein